MVVMIQLSTLRQFTITARAAGVLRQYGLMVYVRRLIYQRFLCEGVFLCLRTVRILVLRGFECWSNYAVGRIVYVSCGFIMLLKSENDLIG